MPGYVHSNKSDAVRTYRWDKKCFLSFERIHSCGWVVYSFSEHPTLLGNCLRAFRGLLESQWPAGTTVHSTIRWIEGARDCGWGTYLLTSDAVIAVRQIAFRGPGLPYATFRLEVCRIEASYSLRTTIDTVWVGRNGVQCSCSQLLGCVESGNINRYNRRFLTTKWTYHSLPSRHSDTSLWNAMLKRTFDKWGPIWGLYSN